MTTGPGSPTPGRKQLLDAVPVWMQAVAAVAGVTLTALGVFGLVGGQPVASQAPAASATAPVRAQPRVTMETFSMDASELRAGGTYASLDPASQVVVLIAQPAADPAATWLPVVANLTPGATDAAGIQDGRWEAVRPATPAGVKYTFYAVIGPKATGAADPYGDLRLHGPESADVVAASGPMTTEG